MLGLTLKIDPRDLELLDAEIVGLRLPDLDLPDPWSIVGGPVDDALAAGNRDENALTDLEFYARHPERKLLVDPKIHPDEKAAIKEWISIRDQVVRPALARATGGAPRPAGGGPAAGPAPGAAPPPPGSNAAVAAQAENTSRRNQLIAGGVGLVALLAVGAAWAAH